MQNNCPKVVLLTRSMLSAAASFGLISSAASAAQPISANANQAVKADAIAQFPPIYVQKEPDAFINPQGDTVDVTLVNAAPGVVSYMLPGTGEYRMLQPNEEVRLTGLATPAQIGFRQLDGGLTRAEVSAVDSETNSATIQFSSAAAPTLMMRAIAIGPYGEIYLN